MLVLRKLQPIRCLLILACLMSLLVFHLPGVSSSKTGAIISSTAPLSGQSQFLKPPLPTRSNTAYVNHVMARLASPFFAPTVTATKSVSLFTDADGDTLISPGDTLKYTVAISNSGTDATGVNFSDTLDANLTLVGGSVHASPLAFSDTYNWVGNTILDTSARGLPSVTANDAAVTDSFTLTTLTNAPTTAGGTVTLLANGHFTYTPPVGFTGTDTFNYTLTNTADASLTDTGTVTINLPVRVWYAQNASVNGNGLSNSPFNSPASASTAANASTDIIYVFSDIGANPKLNGNFALDNNQQLLGQGVNLVANSITLFTAGAAPTLTNTTGNVVTVASNNTISGLILGDSASASADINGSSFGTLTVSSTTINNGTGQALNLSTGTLAATLSSISSTNSGTTGISLTSVAGNLSSGSTSITNPSGIGLSVNTSSATLNFGNTTSTQSGGTGVSLTTNTGTITFGTLNISPDAGQRGLLATDNSQTITASGGAITTSGAAAVEITRGSGTTPLVISLTSVSANGGANGIKLSNTNGSFTVVGDGTNNASGGTIQNTTGVGVSLSNAQNISLTSMSINNTTGSGIRGSNNVVNFSFVNGTINNSNDDGTAETNEANIAFNTQTAGTESNLSGTVTITGSTLTNALFHGVDIFNFNGTISNANISSNTITSTNSTTTSKGSGIRLVAFGSATTVANVTKATIANNIISNFPSGNGIQAQGGNANAAGSAGVFGNAGSATNIISITGNRVAGFSSANRIGTQAILAVVNGKGQGNFDISSNGTLANPITNVVGNAIALSSLGFANVTATVNNNRIVANNSLAAAGIGVGTSRTFAGADTPSLTISINNNNISQTDGNGILATARDATGKLNVTIKNNTVAAPLTGNRNGIRVDAGNSLSVNDSVCLDISGNTTSGTGLTPEGIGLRKQGTSTITNAFGIEGMAATSSPGVETFVDGQNPGSSLNPGTGFRTLLISATSGFSNCSAAPMAPVVTVGESSSKTINSVFDDSVSGSQQHYPDTLYVVSGEVTPESNVQKISQAELNWIVQAALERWQRAGISAADLTRLQAMTFELADLPLNQIAAGDAAHVKIDETAAGYGWFVDQSPLEDSKFEVPVPGKEFQTTELSPAQGKMDLLTVVMRAMGLELSQETLNALTTQSAIMEGALGTGVRRLPTGGRVGAIQQTDQTSVTNQAMGGSKLAFNGHTGFSKLNLSASLPRPLSAFSSLVGNANLRRKEAMPLMSGSVAVSVGTLPAGKTVTIVFRATISDPMPSGVCQVSNQGTITGTNFSTVTTNTVTSQVATPPAITGATISRQQGSAASTSQIATVSDCNQAANTLSVTVNGGASATVNGVTVSGISIDASGNVTASVVAACAATNASFTLTVTDNTNKTATATLTVNVTPNTPPTLGTYPNTTMTPGSSTTVTPSAAPTDNGSVASLTASAPGFTGTFSGNTSTGVITITNANPPGVYTVTVTATDNCGATTTTTFQLTVNTAPTISGATISRQQGTAASTSQIATVSDADQPANTLTVTVNGGASATVNGVTVSGISVDSSGNVTASVVASCAATTANFTLTVTDNVGATATATLTVNVTPNTAPTLGSYPATTVTTGGSTTVTPSAAPTDNGSIGSLTASAPGFTGTFSGNTSTGVITITNAGPTGVYTVTVTATDNCGVTTTTTFQLTVNSPPTITGATISRQQGTAASTSQIATVSDADQPANTLTVTVNGGASATVNGVTVSGISIDNTGKVTASVVASCSASNASFTLTVTDNQGATATATLTVNVTANTAPTLGTYPNTTVSPGGSTTVTPSAAPTDNGSVVSLTASAPGFTGTFSGNTSTGVITITNANPPGNYTVTVTATDNCGATTTRTFTLNVNTPPSITGATITRQQGAPASVSQIATVSDPDQPANTLTVTVTPATGSGVTVSGVSVNAAGQVTASVAASCGATNSTFTVTVTDNQGASSSATLVVNVTPNTAPSVTITGPPSGSLYAVGTAVNFTGTFTDNTTGTHTALWTFTSSTNTFTQAGTVNETTGAVTASFTFNISGVYQVSLAVTDACGATGTANTVNGLLALIVIFDPNGAFVTGGGFINSPAGAYVANPSLTGQANFGFNAKYKNNDTVPTGDTEFHLNVANFNFKSTSYDYLVVDGARAQYQGSGKVNNAGNYGFIVTIIDGSVAGGGGVDKFRIKIWDKNNGNAIVYDSQLGDPDTANPTTPLGGGNVVIHN